MKHNDKPDALEWAEALDRAGARPAAPNRARKTKNSPGGGQTAGGQPRNTTPPARTNNRTGAMTGAGRNTSRTRTRAAGSPTGTINVANVSSVSPSGGNSSHRSNSTSAAHGPSASPPKYRTHYTKPSPIPGWVGDNKGTVLVLILCFLAISCVGFNSMARGMTQMASGTAASQSLQPCGPLQPWADLTKCDLSGRDLRGLDLTGVDLRHSDLTSAYLEGAVLESANLAEANLAGATLRGASLDGATLSGANVEEIDLTGVDLRTTDISGIRSFSKSILRNAVFPEGADLAGVSFVGADLSGSSIYGANLAKSDFEDARLNQTHFTRAVLKGANFEGAKMREAYFHESNLHKAVMKDVHAHGVFFIQTDVKRVDFSGSDLKNSSFIETNVDGAKFGLANLASVFFGKGTRPGKANFENTTCSDGIKSNDCFAEGRLLVVRS